MALTEPQHKDDVVRHEACGCLVRLDYDDEKITTHCAAHCPRVVAGDWTEASAKTAPCRVCPKMRSRPF